VTGRADSVQAPQVNGGAHQAPLPAHAAQPPASCQRISCCGYSCSVRVVRLCDRFRSRSTESFDQSGRFAMRSTRRMPHKRPSSRRNTRNDLSDRLLVNRPSNSAAMRSGLGSIVYFVVGVIIASFSSLLQACRHAEADRGRPLLAVALWPAPPGRDQPPRQVACCEGSRTTARGDLGHRRFQGGRN